MRNTSRFLLSSMRGLFVGRFQPLHLGHVSIIEKALEQVEELVIGIGSAECSYTTKDPFTAGERIEMILRASEELGWNRKIIPIPIRDVNRYSIWVSHVVSLCPDFDIVFSNNPLTVRLFKDAGYKVRSTKLVDREHFSGTSIREIMLEDGSWNDLVPGSTYDLIIGIGGLRRIKEISGNGDRK
jgi:nicotinamide-nucleotide adenylyltransferase